MANLREYLDCQGFTHWVPLSHLPAVPGLVPAQPQPAGTGADRQEWLEPLTIGRVGGFGGALPQGAAAGGMFGVARPEPTAEAEFQPAGPDGGLAPRWPGMLRIRVGVSGRTLPGGLPRAT